MDVGWYQVLTIIGANLGVSLWIWREMRTDMRTFTHEIQKDMKDFHGRLCALEEKYYQMDRKK